MRYPYPYCYCPYCGERFCFPFPAHEESKSHHTRLPKDSWEAQLLCGACGKLWLCSSKDVRLSRPLASGIEQSRRSDDSFFRIEYKCGAPDCGSPIIAFVHSRHYSTAQLAHEKLLKADIKPVCLDGHVWLPDKHEFIAAEEVFKVF